MCVCGRWFLLLCLSVWVGGAACEGALAQEELPVLRGHVTDPGAALRFEVDGHPVICTPGVTQTARAVRAADGIELAKGERLLDLGCPVHAFGEPVQVFGERKKAGVMASRVDRTLPETPMAQGFAIVDRVLSPEGGELARLRADGYVFSVSPATKVDFGKGSALTLASAGTNMWVRYTGMLRKDGMVAASTLAFSPNTVQAREDELRTKTEFDPATVTESDRQSTLSRTFQGVKAKRLPAYPDAAVQSRVDRIGAALVPEFQRRLPDADPTKIHFRFEVVDDESLHWTLTQPSGVVQMPYHLLMRLENDSQLAAILSAEIAEVMEKQVLRAMPAEERLGAMNVAGTAASIFVPGVGLATGIAGARAAAVIERHQEEQSTRTGLCWMADAGFDLREAPVAWWRLKDGKSKGLAKTEVPYRASYLYEVLWRAGK